MKTGSLLFAAMAALFSSITATDALPAQADRPTNPQASTADSFRIGSWNLEFLGADPKFRRDTPPRTDADRRAIGRRIVELGVCVLGVQEICGEAVMAEVAEAAGPTWHYVLGTTGCWDDGKTQQGVGFFYDRAQVELLHAEELLQFPRKRDDVSVFHRKPVTACFRHRATGCDFRTVFVHLKAGRKARDLNKRRLEALTLREWFDTLLADAEEDHDIVLLGDFNSTYGDDPERILEKGDAMRYLDQQTESATIIHFDTPIDQVVKANAFGELQLDGLKVHGVDGEAARQAFRKTYSDHFPITATIRATSGDDDAGTSFRRGPKEQHLPTHQRGRLANLPLAASAEAAASPPATTSPWPPAVGSQVEVMINNVIYRGALMVPLPRDTGWVVIQHGGAPLAWPMARVDSLRPAR